ncbi:MAG TPA: glycosyltransferase family 2 protein [Pyrinomonadaceae bacterium]|nr:glycosyltransferase family 2 protein [Pyrinomonadaceae bacterium]
MRIESKTISGNRKQVSVVLLSHNRPAYLAEALQSLANQSYRDIQITVVDNPSPASAQIEAIVKDFSGVKLIRNDRNVGYTGGMNRGLKQADGPFVLLTEDDIVLKADCIENLVKYFEQNGSSDLVAPIIYDKQGSKIRIAGGHFELSSVYRMTIYGEGEYDTGQFPKPFEVNYVSGAALFARAEFWEELEGFRDDFFMYVDELELCARVVKSGKKISVVPQAKVYHFEPAADPTAPEIEFHKIKNFFSLYLLHAPKRVLPEFLCRYAVLNTVRTMLGRTGSSPRTFIKALLWVTARTPSLLMERYRNGDAYGEIKVNHEL